jgi:hypothetical protein
MASDPNAPRSRRALLAAAAGGAAAVAASAAMPLTAAAAPVNMQTEQDNPTVAQTSVTQSAAGSVAFKARTTNTDAAGLVGSTGDENFIDDDTQFTGVYGFSQADDTDALGSGVWGSSPDTGVVGTGSTGVLGLGTVGVVGVGDPGGIGVVAVGASNTDLALYVDGKVHFTRAGRASIGTGKSSVKVTLPGTTSQSRVFALLHSNRSNRWVRAVVPTTGSFTVYLNASMTSATWVAWFVID